MNHFVGHIRTKRQEQNKKVRSCTSKWSTKAAAHPNCTAHCQDVCITVWILLIQRGGRQHWNSVEVTQWRGISHAAHILNYHIYISYGNPSVLWHQLHICTQMLHLTGRDRPQEVPQAPISVLLQHHQWQTLSFFSLSPLHWTQFGFLKGSQSRIELQIVCLDDGFDDDSV